jgi:hypothetical protein
MHGTSGGRFVGNATDPNECSSLGKNGKSRRNNQSSMEGGSPKRSVHCSEAVQQEAQYNRMEGAPRHRDRSRDDMKGRCDAAALRRGDTSSRQRLERQNEHSDKSMGHKQHCQESLELEEGKREQIDVGRHEYERHACHNHPDQSRMNDRRQVYERDRNERRRLRCSQERGPGEQDRLGKERGGQGGRGNSTGGDEGFMDQKDVKDSTHKGAQQDDELRDWRQGDADRPDRANGYDCSRPRRYTVESGRDRDEGDNRDSTWRYAREGRRDDSGSEGYGSKRPVMSTSRPGYGLQGSHVPEHAAKGRQSQTDLTRAALQGRKEQRRKEEEAVAARAAVARRSYRPGKMSREEREELRDKMEGNAAALEAARARVLQEDAAKASAAEARDVSGSVRFFPWLLCFMILRPT